MHKYIIKNEDINGLGEVKRKKTRESLESAKIKRRKDRREEKGI